MRDVYILGGGMIPFGKFFQTTSAEDMGKRAALEAIRSAGVPRGELQACYCGCALAKLNVGQRILGAIGLSAIPTFNHENACGSGAAAFRDAWVGIGAGLYDLALVVGVEHMTKEIFGLIQAADGDFLFMDMGLPTPAIFSFIAHRHMEQFGTTPEQIAKVSVKNHRHGVHNPYAQYRKECSVQDVLGSRMVADPLTLLQCCPIGDGAAALVLGSEEAVKRHSAKAVRVLASVFEGGRYKNAAADGTTIEVTARASRKAYEAAGVGPEDLDVLEVHDCFSIHELTIYEDVGLCPKGEGGRLLDEGATSIGGRVPVNPSGGLLCKGHPIGATGVAQILEIFWQLRGEAGKRQVEKARVGMAHNAGGVLTISPEPAVCGITILAS